MASKKPAGPHVPFDQQDHDPAAVKSAALALFCALDAIRSQLPDKTVGYVTIVDDALKQARAALWPQEGGAA